jgi:hypothetical protein
LAIGSVEGVGRLARRRQGEARRWRRNENPCFILR